MRITPVASPSIASSCSRRSISIGACSGLAGSSRDELSLPPVILHRRFVADARHDDLAVARLVRAMHGEQIAVEDVGVLHAVAADPQQEIGGRPEQGRIDVHVILDVGGRQDWRAGCNPSEQRQSRRRGLGQPNAARDAGDQLDRPLGSERPQMLVDSLAVLQPQALCDFPARRRQAAVVHEMPDKGQHFQLLGGEIGHEENTRRMSGIESRSV